METDNLIVGWKSIAQVSGRSPHTLIKQQQLGTLPVQPTKVGNQVAMTLGQIAVLKQGGSHGV